MNKLETIIEGPNEDLNSQPTVVNHYSSNLESYTSNQEPLTNIVKVDVNNKIEAPKVLEKPEGLWGKVLNYLKGLARPIVLGTTILVAPYVAVGCNDGIFGGGDGEQSENIIKISGYEKFLPIGNPQQGVEATYFLTITNQESGDQTLWYHIDWDYDGTFTADESVQFTVLGNDFIDFYPTHTFTSTGVKTSWVKVDLAPGETIGIDNESDYTVIVDP